MYFFDDLVCADEISSDEFRVFEEDQDDVGGVKVDGVFESRNLLERPNERLKVGLLKVFRDHLADSEKDEKNMQDGLVKILSQIFYGE